LPAVVDDGELVEEQAASTTEQATLAIASSPTLPRVRIRITPIPCRMQGGRQGRK
jgi:hypothetical protein